MREVRITCDICKGDGARESRVLVTGKPEGAAPKARHEDHTRIELELCDGCMQRLGLAIGNLVADARSGAVELPTIGDEDGGTLDLAGDTGLPAEDEDAGASQMGRRLFEDTTSSLAPPASDESPVRRHRNSRQTATA